MTVSKHSQDGTVAGSKLSFSAYFCYAILPSLLCSVPSSLCLETVIKTYMKLTSAECTVENS